MKKILGIFLSLVIAIAPVNVGMATLVTIPAPLIYPGIVGAVTGTVALATNTTLTATGHYASVVFVARENMVISHVGFRTGTVSGTTPQITASIETIDGTTGIPSGSNAGGSTPSAGTTVSSNTYTLLALGGSATLAKGAMFAVKTALTSGTTPSVVIQGVSQLTLPSQTSLPYNVNNTGTPTKSIINGMSLFALGSSATTFYQMPGALPFNAVGTNAFNNTNSAKRGLKFSLPFNCRIIGIRFVNGQTGDFNAGIYDASGAGVGSTVTAYDGDNQASSASTTSLVYFSTALSYTAGTTYYAAIEPTSATNSNVSTFTLPSTDYLSATPAGNNGIYSVFATSAWTDDNTKIPLLDILIDQIDNGAGSGGAGGRIIGG